MCDFFWPSLADEGDLADVVRASLQQLPPAATPASATELVSADAHGHLPAEEVEGFLPTHGVSCRGNHDHGDEVHLQPQWQLVHGNGMGVTVGSSGGGSCDPLLLHSSPSYPLLEPQQTEGLIRHVMSGPTPQLLGVGEGDCDMAALEMDEQGLDMAMDPHAPAIKRRKSQTKKVVCIPAPTAAPPVVGGRPSTSGEVVPSDLWGWRKYGQKPIKGSPYPRGYYRCSSSKGCSARKQVERSRTDPSMLVITYTSDHNHPWPTQRNVLAGSTSTRPAAAAKSQHSTAATVPPPPTRHHHTIGTVGDSASSSSTGDNNVHQQQVPKQEVLDVMDHPMPEQGAAAVHDLDMFAETDGALNIMQTFNFNPQKQQQQQQLATAADGDDDDLLQDDKQQLLDPFSFNFFDWVGASFGIGDANKGG